jgi:hypothetical protein
MPDFFSLPPELRNTVYNILHQHEQTVDSGRMTFVFPLTHVRNISRRFRDEYDKCSPATSRLVISQGNWCWGKFTTARDLGCLSSLALSGPSWSSAEKKKKKKLAQRLPTLVTLGRKTSYTDLEFNLDVYDEVRRSRDFLADFGHYSAWVETLLYREPHLPRVSCGGEVHLRLFFSYLSTFDALRRQITRKNWFRVQCSKISLVLYSGGDGFPNEASLSRATILAVWTRGVGWQIEEETNRSLHAEIVQARSSLGRVPPAQPLT